jgi:hypothetical protein
MANFTVGAVLRLLRTGRGNLSAGERLTRQDPAQLITFDPDIFLSYTLIIASNIDPALELQLADLLWSGKLALARQRIQADRAASATVGGPDIPLIAIRNSGFLGRVEIQLREHCGRSARRYILAPCRIAF